MKERFYPKKRNLILKEIDIHKIINNPNGNSVLSIKVIKRMVEDSFLSNLLNQINKTKDGK